MLKRWERREGPPECVETVEDEYSVGVDGLNAALEREGIASGCEGGKGGGGGRGLVQRSEATRHCPNQCGELKLAICDRLTPGQAESRQPRTTPPVTVPDDGDPRRRPRTNHVRLQNLEGGLRVRNDWLIHNPHKRHFCRDRKSVV